MSVNIEKLQIHGLAVNLIVMLNGKLNEKFSNSDLPRGTVSQDGDTLNIVVPKNTCLKKPVYLLSIEEEGAGNMLQNHFITVGEGSKAEIIELYYTLTKRGVVLDGNMFIKLEKNAVLDLYKIQNESNVSEHEDHTKVEQCGNSMFTCYTITLSGGKIFNKIEVDLNGENSDASLYGLYLTSEKQRVENCTIVNHNMQKSRSEEFYKGVLDGNSNAIFNGRIYVAHGAVGTKAKQMNQNILLSERATIKSSPALEIYTDDVECNHGAVSGQLDEETLFYMRSRGIGMEKAKELLTYAFATDIINKVKIAPLKKMLEKFLGPRLKQCCHHVYKS